MSELARMLKTYKIDIALVFNSTKSMEPYIERLKKDIRKMPAEVRYTFEKEGRTVESLRIKVIDFGDYGVDGSDAIRQTRFFDTETETDQLADAVNNIKYRGCGGVPNNGLEALYEAMTSDWIELKPNGRRMQSAKNFCREKRFFSVKSCCIRAKQKLLAKKALKNKKIRHKIIFFRKILIFC